MRTWQAKILFVFSVLVSLSLSKGITNKKLQGKVKSIKESTYQALDKFNKIIEGSFKGGYHLMFDIEGNIIEENYYNSKRKLSKKWIYKYDYQGNPTEIDVYGSNGKFKDSYYWIYKYNDEGHVIEAHNTIFIYKKTTYQYNSKGYITEENNYLKNDVSLFRLEYEYDEQGNILKINKYDELQMDTTVWLYKYDSIGTKIMEHCYNSDYSIDVEYTYKYQYDDQNNWIRGVSYKNYLSYEIIKREIMYY